MNNLKIIIRNRFHHFCLDLDFVDRRRKKGTRGLVYYITAISQHCKNQLSILFFSQKSFFSLSKIPRKFLDFPVHTSPLRPGPINKRTCIKIITIIIIIVIIYKHK